MTRWWSQLVQYSGRSWHEAQLGSHGTQVLFFISRGWNKKGCLYFLPRWSSYSSTYPQSSHRDRPADRRPDRWHVDGRVHRWDNCLARRRRRFHKNHGTASKCPFDSGTIEADNDSRRCWIERERERNNDRIYMLSLSSCCLLIQSIVTARHTLCGSASIAAGGIALGITGIQYQLVILIDQLLRLCCSQCHILSVQRCGGHFWTRPSAAKDVLIVQIWTEIVCIEIASLVRGLSNVRARREEKGIRGDGTVAQLCVQQLRFKAHRLWWGAIEDELPFREDARLIDASPAAINHLQGPTTLGLLTPEMHTQEWPIIEIGFDNIPRSLKQQCARGAHGRSQQNTQITTREEAQCDATLHMLQIAHLIDGARTTIHIHVGGQCVAIGAIDFAILIILSRLANMLRRHSVPLFSQSHHSAGIHQTVTELVAIFASHPVEGPAILLLERTRSRGIHNQILHITPSEIRICLECQCTNAGGQRCRCRCARMLHCAYMIGTQTSVHVHRGDTLVVTRRARAIGGCQRWGALFQVPGLEAA